MFLYKLRFYKISVECVCNNSENYVEKTYEMKRSNVCIYIEVRNVYARVCNWLLKGRERKSVLYLQYVSVWVWLTQYIWLKKKIVCHEEEEEKT